MPPLSKHTEVAFTLAESDAELLAAPYKMGAEKKAAPDPCREIPEALLSADHIIEYVKRTGMIAPFDSGDFKKSPLKAASYESKIGKHAYHFEKGNNHPTTIFDGTQEFLTVPANSIVFVESEAFFRLPPFIAVRFNLQINHVHRGLLLGTGPLVDPGFWGRLCIPLHNLTNEDYLIPKEDGLIWIEFTKTSSNPRHGRPPSNTEFPEIKDFILKASKPRCPQDAPPIAIRSSIPDMVETANKNSKDAVSAAKASADAAKSMRNWSFVGIAAGAISVFALAATVAGLSWQYYDDNQADIGEIRAASEATSDRLDRYILDVDRYGQETNEARASVPALRARIESQDEQLRALQRRQNELQAELDRIKPKPRNPNRPAG